MKEAVPRTTATPLRRPVEPEPLERRHAWRTGGVDVYATRWERDVHPDGRAGATTVPAVVLMRRGCYTLRAAGRTVVGDANSATFYNSGEDFAVSHPSARSTAGLTFRVGPEVMEEALAELPDSGGARPEAPFREPHAPLSAKAFLLQHLLSEQLSAPAPDAVLVDEAVLALVREAMWPAVRSSAVPARPRADRANLARIAAAKEYMNASYRERLSLDTISDAAECSPFHLSRQFTRLTGIPVHRYLNRVRLRHALTMIDSGGLTAIALDCGFSGHSHFTSAFRQEFGQTPSSVRASEASVQLRRLLANWALEEGSGGTGLEAG